MLLPSLEKLSNDSLLEKFGLLKGSENSVIADVVLHLSEIDKRGIYRDAGYSSLFSYCRERWGYSEGSASRRIRAARMLGESPEIYELLRAGKISLCALSEVAPVITSANRTEVLAKVEGASKRTACEMAVQFGAPVKPKRDCIRPRVVITPPVECAPVPVVEKRYSFSFEVKEDVRELYEEVRELTGHCGIAEVFEKALRALVEKQKPKKVRKAPPVAANKATRYIPKSVRREVRERDGGRCAFVSEDGKRCSERCGLEVDHVVPFACGGTRETDNLRLLCRAHNQLCAERVFGSEFMEIRRNDVTQRKGAESQ